MLKQSDQSTTQLIVSLACWLCFAITASATPPQPSLFDDHIRPLLKERCFACHGALRQEANLRVDTVFALSAGGDSGPAITPFQPENSLILSRITSSNLSMRMPPEGHAIDESQISLIKTWIANGAPPPTNDHPEPAPTDHWAFQPITRPEIITLSQSPTLNNPIDHFLSLELAPLRISPLPIAEPSIRIRRLYLDLIGIPPTPLQLEHFLANPTPESYNQIADRLLHSPQHGERWARHWMDVWRYADWFGRRYVPDVWNSAPQIWHWRDWIVQALNDDIGYQQMVLEMLAADETKPGDPKAAVATGFLIRNWYALNPNDWMRNNVEHTGKAFLGLTFQCAHCHDHKYDPITQEDYFSFRAFFEPIGIRQDQIPGQPDPGPFQEYEYSTLRKVQRLGIVSIFDKNPAAKTFYYANGDERNRDPNAPSITPKVPKFLAHFFPTSISPIELPPEATYPGLNPDLHQALLKSAQEKIQLAQAHLTKTQAQLVDSKNTTSQQEALTKLRELESIHLQPNNIPLLSHTLAPLAGQQSLLFNATSGRRMMYRSLPEVKDAFDQALISFDITLLSKAHFNFQLTRDNTQGLTATFIGFENGEIKAYQPNSFQEFTVAQLDNNQSIHQLHVELQVDRVTDQCLLSIKTLTPPNYIATSVPIALNQWNPHNDTTKGILFDARPGSLTAIDNLVLTTNPKTLPAPMPLLQLDFELPSFPTNSDLADASHWQTLQFCIPPADSRIVAEIPTAAAIARANELTQLRRITQIPQLKLQAAQAQLVAAQTELDSLQATIIADLQMARLSHDSPQQNEPSQLATQAHQLQQLANLRNHEAAQLAAECALAECEAKPATDPDRASDITTANASLNQARVSLDKAKKIYQLEPSQDYQPLTRTYPSTSTGRRKALAQWITHPENPLTARVAVNHIWMRHFHKPLVPSVFDFGRNSPPPKQLALLNWLAAELIHSNWSMKRIHYLIVTSQAFQRSSAWTNPQAQTLDRDNELYWRMNTGRMEAEVIRDSLLQIANSLDRTIGGQELENNLSFTTYRKSLYYCCQPEDDGKSPIGQLFDGPDPTDCYRRTRTIIPQQALALTNSPLIHQVSQRLHEQLDTQMSRNPTPHNYVNLAFHSILSRPPTKTETLACVEFLTSNTPDTTSGPSTSPPENLPTSRYISFLRALFNHNDFVTIR